MVKEIIGRFLTLILTILSYSVDWKLALITPPLVFKFYNLTFCARDRIAKRKSKLILDIITHAFHYGYLIYSIVICNLNIDKWYSWLIGIAGWLVLGQLFGFLWPRRWHYEKVEGDL